MEINMEQLVVALGLLPSVSRPEVNLDCPACGRKKKLNMNFRKDVFACPACGAGGGVMDAWALFRGISDTPSRESRKLAKIDMVRYFGNNEPKPAPKKVYEKPQDIASLITRDAFNRKLLEICPLTEEHRKNLLDRGLSEEQIRLGMFGSSRRISQQEIEEHFREISFDGVPGGYVEDGKKKISYFGPGILIPEWTCSGKIQGLVIRRDKADKNKYLTYSSEKRGGTKGRTFTSFTNFYDKDVSEVILTEGPLKGAVINCLSEKPVIAVPGVNSQKYLNPELERLKKKGLRKIIICYDMDYRSKDSVQKALTKLKQRLSSLEIPFVQWEWDERYKGLDDYLSSKKDEMQ